MIDFPGLPLKEAQRLNGFIAHHWEHDVMFALADGTMGQLVQAFAPARERLAQYDACVNAIACMPVLASDLMIHTLTPLERDMVRRWAREWTLLSSDPNSLMPVDQEVIDLGTQLAAALAPNDVTIRGLTHSAPTASSGGRTFGP